MLKSSAAGIAEAGSVEMRWLRWFVILALCQTGLRVHAQSEASLRAAGSAEAIGSLVVKEFPSLASIFQGAGSPIGRTVVFAYFSKDRDSFWYRSEILMVDEIRLHEGFSTLTQTSSEYSASPGDYEEKFNKKETHAVFLGGLVTVKVPTAEAMHRIVRVQGDLSSFRVGDSLTVDSETKIVTKGKPFASSMSVRLRVLRVGANFPELAWVPGDIVEVEQLITDRGVAMRERFYVSLKLGIVVHRVPEARPAPGETVTSIFTTIGLIAPSFEFGARSADAMSQLVSRSKVARADTQKSPSSSESSWLTAMQGLTATLQAIAARKGVTTPTLPFPPIRPQPQLASAGTPPSAVGSASFTLPPESFAGASQGSPERLPQASANQNGAGGGADPFDQIDQAIESARAALKGVPAQIDGCPASAGHLSNQLPVCRENDRLIKLRELVLLSDFSFRKDMAEGFSLKQIALTNADAARQLEAALKGDEDAMNAASADGVRAQARIAAIRASPPVCDAGPPNAFGMSEQSYQAYVATYMAVIANRASSAIAACRARAANR